MEDDLDHLDLLLEASGGRDSGGDDILKLLCLLEEGIGGGGGDAHLVDLVGCGESHLCKQLLLKGSVDGVADNEG